MNKSELIDAMAEKCEFSKADTGRALNAFLDTIKEVVKKGDELSLSGIFSIKIQKRKAKKGHNPKTGAEIKIPARNIVRIKAGSELKASAN